MIQGLLAVAMFFIISVGLLFAFSAFLVYGLPFVIIIAIINRREIAEFLAKRRKTIKELEAQNLCWSYDLQVKKWGYYNFVTKEWNHAEWSGSKPKLEDVN